MDRKTALRTIDTFKTTLGYGPRKAMSPARALEMVSTDWTVAAMFPPKQLDKVAEAADVLR